MSRHEGVSCDACSKKNFRGRRYKCLICYDYDLCAACYESGAPTTNHSSDHPVQCILTRSDFDMYYGGESLTVEQAQSFTCPYCGKMGFTETTLQEHLASEHTETASEVVCPVCASQPGGEPNLVTDDLSGHLTLEHRGGGPRDLISFLDEPGGVRHGSTRRTPHPSRGVGSNRPRRCNMHYSASSGISSLSPASREADPIVELLSQLSGVRRSAAGGGASGSSNTAGSGTSTGAGSGAGQGSTPTQLQQLQIQLQLERQQVREHLRHHQAARQQLERLPRRQNQAAVSASGSTAGGAATGAGSGSGAAAGSASGAAGQGTSSWTTVVVSNGASDGAATNLPQANPQFLLSRYIEPTLSESELEEAERERADHSLFVQELMLSTMTEVAASTAASIPAPAPVSSMPSAALRGSESHPSGRDLGPSGRESPSRDGPSVPASACGGQTPSASASASASASNPSSSCVPPKTTSSASPSASSSTPPTTSAMTSSSSAVIPKRSSTRVAQVTTSSAPTTAATTTTTSAPAPTPTSATAATTMATTNTTARPQGQAQAQAHHPAAAAAAAAAPGVRGSLTTRVVTGTGTIREMVGAASFNSPGSTRRKPVRPATEPPPPH